MYIQDKNFYISNENKILFDLNEYRIFYITEGIRQYLEAGDKCQDFMNLNENEADALDKILSYGENQPSESAICNAVKIHVSNTCNLKCKYCYANGGNYGSSDSLMDIKTAEKVVQFIHTSEELKNIKYITFFGGEPLLNPEIIEYICEKTQEKRVGYLLQTNGTIVDDNIIRILKKYDITLTISLDGPEQVNDFNRMDANGNGTYKNIIGNIQLLREKGINPIGIEATLSAEFIETYSKEFIADFLYENTGIQHIKVEYDSNLGISFNEKEGIRDEVEQFFDKCINGHYIMDGYAYKIISTFLGKSYNDFVCGAGNKVLTIDVQGHIFPCQLFLEDHFWNIGDITKGVTNNLLPLYQKSKKEPCKNCSARSTCSGCIAMGMKESGCERNRLNQEIVLEAFACCIKAGQFDKLYNKITSL